MKLHSITAALLAAFSLTAAANAQTLQLEATKALEDLVGVAQGPALEVDLSEYFEIDGVTGQIVEMDFSREEAPLFGVINIEMLADAAPANVANFLNYVDDMDYDNSIIHRSLADFVLQGGGFTASFPVGEVPADDPVVNEFSLSNLIGTLSMAKLDGDPNSATNEFFINLGDNSANLDEQNGGFTVFARVIGTGMDVVEAMEGVTSWSGIDLLQNGFPFDDVPLLGTADDPIAAEFMIVMKTARRVSMYPDTDGNPSMIAFEAVSSDTDLVTASFDGSTLVLTPSNANVGTATITVTATDTNGNSIEDTLEVQVNALTPLFSSQPMPRVVEIGRPVTLAVEVVSSTALTYQWNLDGNPIAGANSATYEIASFQGSDAGAYTLSATNAEGATLSNAADIEAVTKSGRLINISTRGVSRSGEASLIVGFFLSGGAGEKEMVIRGVGPDLADRGVTGAMPDPLLRFRSLEGLDINNDNWETGTDLDKLAELLPRSGAQPFQAGSKDSLLIGSYPVTGYSALVGPNVGEVDGIVLAEVFDADEDRLNSDIRLFNISTRAEVGTGENVLIAGFWIAGDEKANVLIRAIGPGLESEGVQNFITDPQLTVKNGLGQTIGYSDDWEDTEVKASLIRAMEGSGAIVPDTGSKDAAIVMTLEPGGYSVDLSSVDGQVGVGLVEVFEVR